MADSKADTSRLTRKHWLFQGLWSVIFLALIAYIVSYYVISRRGMAEASANNSNLFFYVSWKEYSSDDPNGRRTHARLLCLYAPLNWIDVKFFGGMPAARGGIWKLSIFQHQKLGEYV